MKIDFSQELKQIDGASLDPPAKLGKFASDALLFPNIPDDKATGEEKAKRFMLALKVVDAGKVDLKTDEIAKIKDLIGKIFPPLVVGQAWQMLEDHVVELEKVDA